MNPTRSVLLLTSIALALSSPLLAQRGGHGGAPARPPSTARPADRPIERRTEDRDQQRDQDRVREHVPTPAERPLRANLAERLENRAEWCREIGLTEAQQAEVHRIRERQRQEIQTVERRWLMTRNQKQERIREIVARHNQEVQGLLTPDQSRLLETLQLREREQLQNP